MGGGAKPESPEVPRGVRRDSDLLIGSQRAAGRASSGSRGTLRIGGTASRSWPARLALPGVAGTSSA
eukprot:4382655-Lingulodinium_polyedra.AAC.1